MSKILVIKPNHPRWSHIWGIVREIEDGKDVLKDVIEFEAEIDTFAKIGEEVVHYIPIPEKLIQRIVHPDSNVQVFIVKKEGKTDEKDVPHS